VEERRDTSPSIQPSRDEDERHWADWLGRLLWDVSTRTSALGEAALADTPLTLSALGVLDWIADHPGITIAEITRRSPTTQQAISQIVARLEKLGLVQRQIASGRAVGLNITGAGSRARDEGNEMRGVFEQRLREALGDDRHDELLRLLEEMRAAVIELEGQDGSGPFGSQA
jgi:DNA-binding MarR family transcriptional regulator